jgi:hypothetical protein
MQVDGASAPGRGKACLTAPKLSAISGNKVSLQATSKRQKSSISFEKTGTLAAHPV